MGGWLSCRYQFLCRRRVPVLASATTPFKPVSKHVFRVRSSETNALLFFLQLWYCLDVSISSVLASGLVVGDNPAGRFRWQKKDLLFDPFMSSGSTLCIPSLTTSSLPTLGIE